MPSDRKASTFLDLIRRSERGRLKVYLGYAPGVGKTYLMLQEGRRLKQEGIDVVVGLVETHGRSDTAALLEGLEIVPRKPVSYRGITLEEMDTEALLARKPRIALVDELAHTNPPDSKNAKRYMDVEELLAAGIHVISTMNVQHLESLYNTVEGLVNVRVAERVPDLVLKQADEIVNVDLSPEDLIKRLEKGKIYPQERISLASQNYFQSPRLEQLRELTLRETASQIDFKRREQHEEGTGTPPDQVVVCLSASGPNNANLLRYGSRLAGRLNRRWYAVHVQTLKETPLRIDAGKQRVLADALTLANQLGAMVFTLKGEDVVETILRFAHDYRAGHIVIGRPNRRTPIEWLFGKPNNVERLIERGHGYRIVVLDERLPEPSIEPSLPELSKQLQEPRRGFAERFQSNNILVWQESRTKTQAITELHNALQSALPKNVKSTSLKLILNRETEMSTFLNEGIAVPHSVIPGLDKVHFAIGIPKHGISDANPEAHTHAVLLALYPPELSSEYLTNLAKAAALFRDRNKVEQLASVETPENLLAWLKNNEVGKRA
jgi:two-component system sensor histidine kinase KdpD